MKRELALEFARVTEAAALAAYKWVGRGNKESADQAAVDAMRTMLNRVDIHVEIVIGEGEIEEHLMLYIHNVAKALNKDLTDLIIVILDKPTQTQIIKDLQALGIKVYALPVGVVGG